MEYLYRPIQTHPSSSGKQDHEAPVVAGELLSPWLYRMPNIKHKRAERLTTSFGHDLVDVLKDIRRMAEVAQILEPGKPALAARIAAQVYAGMAMKSCRRPDEDC